MPSTFCCPLLYPRRARPRSSLVALATYRGPKWQCLLLLLLHGEHVTLLCSGPRQVPDRHTRAHLGAARRGDALGGRGKVLLLLSSHCATAASGHVVQPGMRRRRCGVVFLMPRGAVGWGSIRINVAPHERSSGCHRAGYGVPAPALRWNADAANRDTYVVGQPSTMVWAPSMTRWCEVDG